MNHDAPPTTRPRPAHVAAGALVVVSTAIALTDDPSVGLAGVVAVVEQRPCALT